MSHPVFIPDRVAILGVPSSAGARHTGCERAPALLRRVGFPSRLNQAGFHVVDLGDLPPQSYAPDPGHPSQQNVDRVHRVAVQVADAVREAVRIGARPIVMGGDCTIALGVIAGLLPHCDQLGLVYLDGDLDLNTPATTPSGILDGMGLAHLLGEGVPLLAGIGGELPMLLEKRVCVFGYSEEAGSIDEYELTRLRESGILRYPRAIAEANPERAAGHALANLDTVAQQLVVHFDVDVIDSDELPAGDVRHVPGMSVAAVRTALTVFLASPKVAALVITEFNAIRADSERIAGILRDLLLDALVPARAAAPLKTSPP